VGSIRVGQVVYVRIPGTKDVRRGRVVNIIEEIGTGPLYIVQVADKQYPVSAGEVVSAQ